MAFPAPFGEVSRPGGGEFKTRTSRVSRDLRLELASRLSFAVNPGRHEVSPRWSSNAGFRVGV